MSSINTNVAAMTALQTLTETSKSLTEVQKRISTGFKVGEASDNAAYWSIATTMRSDNSSNSSRSPLTSRTAAPASRAARIRS